MAWEYRGGKVVLNEVSAFLLWAAWNLVRKVTAEYRH